MSSELDKQPSVGAVIVNWNCQEDLQVCLTHLAAQEIAFAKVIVVDNNSDSQPDELGRAVPKNTHYIRLSYNAGFARANNIAVQQLKDCDWIALINPDAFLGPVWLKSMIDATDRYPETDCFASRLVMASLPVLLDGVGDVYHASGLVWRDGHGQPIARYGMAEGEVFGSCAAAALYRRDAFIAVGGFDEDFFCYVEDIDLAFRLRLAGHRCMLVPDAIAHHVGSASTGGKHSDFAVYQGHRNLVWTFVKDMPSTLFWVLLPLHIAMNIATIIWVMLRGQGKVILRAKWDAIKGVPKMWSKRREIQKGRVASLGNIWRAIDKSIVPRF